MNQPDTDTKKELVKAVITVASTVLSYYVARKMMQPDFFQTAHMRTALILKRVAQRNADAWQNIADQAASSYHKART
jgi:hypothetical protein